MFKKSIAMVCATLSIGGCVTSNILKEPERTILYSALLSKGLPITVIKCFEDRLDPKNDTDAKINESVNYCIKDFQKDKEQEQAWINFLKQLQENGEPKI